MRKRISMIIIVSILFTLNACKYKQGDDSQLIKQHSDSIVEYLSYDSLMKILPAESAQKLQILKPVIERNVKFRAGSPLNGYIKYINTLDSLYKSGYDFDKIYSQSDTIIK